VWKSPSWENETERGPKTSPEFLASVGVDPLMCEADWTGLFPRQCLDEEGCRVLMYLQEEDVLGTVRSEHATLILAVDRKAGSQFEECLSWAGICRPITSAAHARCPYMCTRVTRSCATLMATPDCCCIESRLLTCYSLE
jgi:hypothetical protein